MDDTQPPAHAEAKTAMRFPVDLGKVTLAVDLEEVLRSALKDKAGKALLTSVLAEDPSIINDIADLVPDKKKLPQYIRNAGQFLPIAPSRRRPAGVYEKVKFAGIGLKTLIENYEFETVLDVGAGAGVHARVLHDFGKKVTKLDFGTSVYAQRTEKDGIRTILADINKVELNETFDCIWASHVLEHQPNVGHFLQRLKLWTKPEGIMAISVPPAKFTLVGGHLSLWTPGLLVYNLVMNGIDCSDAKVLHYGYNITAIIRNRHIEPADLHYDTGDVNRLAAFMPEGFREGMDGFAAVTP